MATLREIREGVSSELSSKILDGVPLLRHSSLDVIASTVSFLQYSTEIALQNKFETLTPLRAVGETLDGWGAFAGVTRLQPTEAQGEVVLTGTAGVTVPAGALMTRCDGAEYRLDEEFTFPTSGDYRVSVTATETGPSGNLQVGGVLNLGTVVPGLAQTAISDGLGGGSLTESDDSYRLRIVSALRNRCRYGTRADYEYWTRLYPGVTRVCVIPKGNGPGTVKIFFMMDNSYPDGLPLQADIDAVYEMIFGEDGYAPLGVCGDVCLPEIVEVDVSVVQTGGPTVQGFQQIEDSVGSIIESSFDCDSTEVCRADIEIAIREAVPDSCFNLVIPQQNVRLDQGQFPVLGTLEVF